MKDFTRIPQPEGRVLADSKVGKRTYTEPRLVRHGSLEEITAGGGGGPQGDLFGSTGFSV